MTLSYSPAMTGHRIMNAIHKPLGSSILGAALLATTMATAQAGPQGARRDHDRRDGYVWVSAESRWGHGVVSGPVRQTSRGLEVRMPGGTWIGCARTCSETLRTETIDFWESHGRDAKDGGPNYLDFRFDF